MPGNAAYGLRLTDKTPSPTNMALSSYSNTPNSSSGGNIDLASATYDTAGQSLTPAPAPVSPTPVTSHPVRRASIMAGILSGGSKSNLSKETDDIRFDRSQGQLSSLAFSPILLILLTILIFCSLFSVGASSNKESARGKGLLKKALVGFEKGLKLNSKKMAKNHTGRNSESDIFFELENKKESAEDGKKRAIQISLLNWNKLVLTQLMIQEKENNAKKDLLNSRASSSTTLLPVSKDVKGLLGLAASNRSNHLSNYDSKYSTSDNENENEERRKDVYFAHHPKTIIPAMDYPPLLYVLHVHDIQSPFFHVLDFIGSITDSSCPSYLLSSFFLYY